MGATSTPSRRHAPRAPESARGLIAWTVAVVVLAVVVVTALWAVRHVLLLVYVAALLAIGITPVVRWGERGAHALRGGRPVPRWLVVVFLYLVGLALVGCVAALVLPTLAAQVRDFAASAPQMLARAQGFLRQHGLGEASSERVQDALPAPSDVAGRAFGAIGGVLGGAFGIATILILTFYFLLDAERLADAWVHLVPRDRRDQARAIARRVGEKVSAWLVGQLIVGALIGVTAGVALMLLGVRFFYVLALVTAVGEFIPFIGPFIAGTIASLIAATTSLQLAVVTAAYYVVQQLVEVNIVVPRIMGHQVGLDGAAVIIAVLLGHALLGVVGAILAVPTAAILQATVQEVAARPE